MPITPEQFQDRMKRAGPRMLKNIKREFVKIGLRMETQAKVNATTYPRVVTGRLRSSINSKVTTSEGSPQIILRAGGTHKIAEFAGTQVNYARAIEFGTDRIKPRLFMGRAVKTMIKRIDPEISKAMRLSLEGSSGF